MASRKPRRVDALALALAVVGLALMVFGIYEWGHSGDSGISLLIAGIAFGGLAALRFTTR